MADVKTKFIGESDQAIKEIEKLERAMVKLRESNLKLAQTTKETAHESHSMFRETIEEYTKMATGLVTVEKAVDFVKEAYVEWREEIKELGKEAEKSSASLVHLLSKTGDLAHGKEIEEWIKKSGVAPEVLTQSFDAVSGSARALSRERRQELALEVAKSNVVHGDVQGTGELVGQIAKINRKLSPEDALDVATLLRQKAGNRAEELSGHNSIETALQLVESKAATADEAFGLLATALQNEGSTKMLDKAASSVKNPGAKIKPKRGKRLTDEQIAHNAFVDASPRERLQLLLRDEATQEAVLGNVGAARFSRISPDDIAKAAAEVDRAMKGDLAKRNVEQLEGFQAGREHKRNVEVKTHTAVVNEQTAETNDAQARLRAEEEFNNQIKAIQDKKFIGPIGAAAYKAEFRVGQWMSDLFPGLFGPGGLASKARITRAPMILRSPSMRYIEGLESEKRAVEADEETPKAKIKGRGFDPAWIFGLNLPPMRNEARELLNGDDQRLMGRRHGDGAGGGQPQAAAADAETKRTLNQLAANSQKQVELQKEANDIARTRPPFVPSPYTHREW